MLSTENKTRYELVLKTAEDLPEDFAQVVGSTGFLNSEDSA